MPRIDSKPRQRMVQLEAATADPGMIVAAEFKRHIQSHPAARFVEADTVQIDQTGFDHGARPAAALGEATFDKQRVQARFCRPGGLTVHGVIQGKSTQARAGASSSPDRPRARIAVSRIRAAVSSASIYISAGEA